MTRPSGFIARFSGDCARCGQPYIAGQHRIVGYRGGRYIHVGCASGADDE